VEGDQGGGRQRRGGRHRHALGQGAAERPAQAGATPERGGQRRGECQDAEDGGEAELPADVGGDAGVDREGHQRRHGQPVEARGAPPRQRRQHGQRAHHAGPLDRRPRPRQGDVDRDQPEHPEQPGPQRQAERGEQRHRQKRQERDVLPRHGQEMGEAGAAEVGRGPRVDALVLAEDEAPGQGGLSRRHPRAECGLGPRADAGRVGEGQGDDRHDAERDRHGRGALPRHKRQGCRRARSASIVAGPIPLTWSSWSTEESPPC
jgi:hypothetical protein